MVEPAAMNAFDACVFSQAYGRQKHLRMLILNRSRKFVRSFPEKVHGCHHNFLASIVDVERSSTREEPQ